MWLVYFMLKTTQVSTLKDLLFATLKNMILGMKIQASDKHSSLFDWCSSSK